MTDTNVTIQAGRLTRDCDVSYTKSGTAIGKFGIAVNRNVKRNDAWNEEVSFVDVTVWGKTAENLKPYLLKGKQVVVTGSLVQDRWENEGKNFSKLYIVANSVQLVGGKGDNGNSSYKKDSGTEQKSNSFTPKKNANQQQYDNSQEQFTEDIPF